MAVVKNLMVRAGADFSAITKQSNKVKASMKGMQTSVSKSCSLMTSAASGMKKAFSAIGAVLSVSAIVSFGKEAKAAYDTQAEGEAKLAQAMRNTIGATDDEISAIKELLSEQQALGVIGDEVQLAGAQQLAAFVTTTDTLQQLIPILNDMTAQQYGLGATTENSAAIAKIFGKVLSGQTGALTRYGYSFTAAQEAVLKYGTEAEKAAVLAEVVGQKVGGMNSALASTPTGRLQQVSNTLGDIKEQFGAALSNVLVLFLPALKIVCTLLEKAAALAGKVAQTLANVFGSGPGQAAATLSTAGAVTDAMEDLEEAAEAAEEATNSTFGFDQITKQSNPKNAESEAEESSLPGAIAAGVDAADEAGESIGWLEAKLQKLMESSFPAFLGTLAAAGDVLSAALERMQPFGNWLWTSFLQPIAGWAGDAFVDRMARLEESLSNLADLISGEISFGEFVASLGPLEQACLAVAAAMSAVSLAAKGLAAVVAVIGITKSLKSGTLFKLAEVFKLVAGGAGTLSEAMVAVFGKVTTVFSGIASIVGGAVLAATNFFTMLKDGFSWVKEALMVLGIALVAVGAVILGAPAAVAAAVAGIVAAVATLVVVIKDNWESVKAFFAELWGNVKTIFQGFTDFFAGVFTGNIDRAVTGIGNIFGGLKAVVNNVFDAAANICSGFFGSLEDLFGGRLPLVVAMLKETLLVAVSWIKEALGGLLDSWKQIFTGIATFLSGVFSGNWSKAWSGIVQVGKGSINVLITAVESFVNFFVKALNAVIGAVNKLSIEVPEWVPGIGGETFGFKIPEIQQLSLPRLATGAVIPPNNEFVAVLGDQTSGNNIEAPEALIRKIVREESGGKSSSPIRLVIPVYVGGRKITEKIIEDINDLTRTTGECPIMI